MSTGVQSVVGSDRAVRRGGDRVSGTDTATGDHACRGEGSSQKREAWVGWTSQVYAALIVTKSAKSS